MNYVKYDDEKIIKDYRDGKPLDSITAQTGASMGYVYSCVARAGLPMRGKGHTGQTEFNLSRLSDHDKRRIIMEKEQGATLAEIYLRWHINKSTFYAIWESRAWLLTDEDKATENVSQGSLKKPSLQDYVVD